MIKVSVLYPNADDARFDMQYYVDKHFPLVREKLGAALKKTAIDEGVGGAAPGSPAPYAAIMHLFFDSVESFQAAFGPNADAIMSDIPNYTDIEPIVQISRVKL